MDMTGVKGVTGLMGVTGVTGMMAVTGVTGLTEIRGHTRVTLVTEVTGLTGVTGVTVGLGWIRASDRIGLILHRSASGERMRSSPASQLILLGLERFDL